MKEEEFGKLIDYIAERTNMLEGYLGVSPVREGECMKWIKEVNRKLEDYYKKKCSEKEGNKK